MIYFELTKPYIELLFCEKTTGKVMELACFENHGPSFSTLIVKNSTLRFGVPVDGRFYCVLCEGAFVMVFKTVSCGGNEAVIQNGALCCRVTEDGTSHQSTQYSPIYAGMLTLWQDGSFSVHDYHWQVSPQGNPVVYVRDSVAVDSLGNLVIQERYRYPMLKQRQYISATSDARQCITSDRKILGRRGIGAPNGELVVDVAGNWFCDVVLTQNGNIYYSECELEWIQLGTNATVFAVGENHVAFADKSGYIHIYQYDEKDTLRQKTILHAKGKHISDLDIDFNALVLLCSDGTYDVIRWKTATRHEATFLDWEAIVNR